MIEDEETRQAFSDHVRKLEWLAQNCPDEDRRCDAVRSLAAVVLLIGEDAPPDPGDEDDEPTAEIVDLIAWKRAA